MLISIITPVYNAASTLRRTLDSLSRIRPQHRQEAQIVLINDGSEDDSLSMMRQFVDSGLFAETILLDQPNGGSSAARNAGMRQAHGHWILFLDADDELAYDPVQIIREVDIDTSAIICSVQFYKNGKAVGRLQPPKVTKENHLDQLTAGNVFHPTTLIFRKDRVNCPFNESLWFIEDWDFWLRNPEIFEKTRLLTHETLATVHATNGCKTEQHVPCGEYRSRIADTLSVDLSGQLTLSQKNNLRIQAHIGRLQSGQNRAVGPFFYWPCNPKLYVKLWAYSILRNKVNLLTPYG